MSDFFFSCILLAPERKFYWSGVLAVFAYFLRNNTTKLFCVFINSDYFYGAPSSPLPLRGAPDPARILCRSFTPKRHRQFTSEGLAQCFYVATRAGFELTTLRTKGDESTNDPPRPTRVCIGLHPACH